MKILSTGGWLLLVCLTAPAAAQDPSDFGQLLGVIEPGDDAPAAAQSAQRRFDVFAGGGVVVHDTSFIAPQVGGGVWVGQHLRVGGRLGMVGVGLLSTHLRLPLTDDADLLVGTTPIWCAPDQDIWIAPAAEVFASARISPRLRVEFGPSIYVGDGGFVHLMGRAVYSFD